MMIDRTTFDLRMAEHQTATACINDSAWRQSEACHRPLRGAMATALVALATRLAPEYASNERAGQPVRRPATV